LPRRSAASLVPLITTAPHYLGEHGDVAREYEALKRQLATRFDAAESASREAYGSAKDDFIRRIVQVALAAGYPRHLRDAV
jgi:GrpB protein